MTVVRTSSYEPELVKAQFDNGVGIFQCDEYEVFSNGGVIQVGWQNTVEIAVPPVQMGDLAVEGTTTNSWLNTRTFLEMWDMIITGGKWWDHEWTVKVDPDAVFFPSRLHEYLSVRTSTTDAYYVGNCDRTWHDEPAKLKLFGSLEIFSRNAVGTYKAYNERCKAELPWHNWGEDFFMQICLEHVGVKALNGTAYFSDQRCHWSPCTDTTKVVFHDFKTTDQWFQCLGQSNQNELAERMSQHDQISVVMKRLQRK